MNEGVFTCADLLDVTIRVESMFADPTYRKNYVTQAETARAVLTEQNATATPLTDPMKKNAVRVYWVEDCGTDVSDCTDECTIDGAEAQANCADYELTICRESTFSVNEETFETSNLTREEVTARQFARALQKLDEDVAKTAVAKIDSFAGVNKYTGGVGQVSGTDTFIPAANLNAEIVGYLSQVAVLNRANNPYIIDGDLLYQQQVIAAFKQGQPENSDLPMLTAFRKYYDLFNVNAVLAPAKKMFMIDKSAVAIVSRAKYGETPVTISNGANITRFSVASPTLPGMRYDVTYKTKCVDSFISHHYKIIARFDVFLNPVSACDPEQTGVLSFTCGSAPVTP